MILRLLARIAGSKPDRISLLARHREYDHMMQPVTQVEYAAVNIFRMMIRLGLVNEGKR